MTTSQPATAALDAKPAGRPSAAGWRRFVAYRLSVPAVVVLLLLALAAFVGPFIYTVDPNAVDPTQFRKPPSSLHILGTDSAGRDVLARLLVGGQVSLLVGLAAAASATVVGVLLGAASGYFRGWLDVLLDRLSEIFQTFPTLIMIIVLAALLGSSLGLIVLVVALMEWPRAFRVVRGLTMSLREQDAIQAVVGLGAGNGRIVLRHIIPQVLGPATVVATLLTASVILLEAGLSFLGLGVPPPTATWGAMLSDAQSLSILQTMPWLWVPPGIAIALTVLAVNFIGEGLRDAVDPKQGTR
ncbi:MAG: ABC transporter permease [Propionibacteriaceae bacterium]|nr:ABC transporter permease [Propionibacteriaceae bacterium]